MTKNELQPKKPFLKRFWWVFIILGIGIIIAVIVVSDYLEDKKYSQGGNIDYDEQRKVGPKPTISLPFSAELAANSLNPMGETLHHPVEPGKPTGHPGIDFEWNRNLKAPLVNYEPRIIASMDAEIVAIKDEPTHPGTKIVKTAQEGWAVDYGELETVNENLKVGGKVKKGDYIGIPFLTTKETDNPYHRLIHWQFGYYDKRYGVEPRLCPLTYFDSESRALIEKIWEKNIEIDIKANAPEICSNYYKNRNE